MHHLIKDALPAALLDELSRCLRDEARKHGVDSKRHFDARMKTFFIGHAGFVAKIVALPAIRQFVGSRLKRPVVHHAFPLIKGANAPETLPHQDATFWPFDATRSMFTLWVALEPTDFANGCLRFGPSTNELLPHEDVETAGGKTHCIPPGRVTEYVDVPMNRGDAVFFDSAQIHAAFPNRTAEHRYSMKIVFGEGTALPAYWFPCDDISKLSYYRHNPDKAATQIRKRVQSLMSRLGGGKS